MRGGAPPLVAWGLGLIAVAVLGTLAFGLDVLPTLLLAGAGAGSVAVGIGTRLVGTSRPRRADADVEPENSGATVAVALGFSVALVGVTAAGSAFTWIGAGLMVIAAGSLAGAALAERRELASLDQARPPTEAGPK